MRLALYVFDGYKRTWSYMKDRYVEDYNGGSRAHCGGLLVSPIQMAIAAVLEWDRFRTPEAREAMERALAAAASQAPPLPIFAAAKRVNVEPRVGPPPELPWHMQVSWPHRR